MQKMNKSTSGFIELITIVLMYTSVGLLASILYMLVASALSLPQVGILALLGLWWLWFLVFAPPVIFYISALRATDPLTKFADALGPLVKKEDSE